MSIPDSKSTVVGIADDVWVYISCYLNSCEFLSFQQTCKHLNQLTNPGKSATINRYWKQKSIQLCTNVTRAIANGFEPKNWYYFYRELIIFLKYFGYISEHQLCSKYIQLLGNITIKSKYSIKTGANPILLTCFYRGKNPVLMLEMLLADIVGPYHKRDINCNYTLSDINSWYAEATIFDIALGESSGTKILKYLLSNPKDLFPNANKLDVASPTWNGQESPLISAVYHHYHAPEIIQLLLKHASMTKSAINATKLAGFCGRTALWFARERNLTEIVKILENDKRVLK